jgi:hypothetical protein
MQKYDDRVFAVFKKLVGKKYKDVIQRSAELIEQGKNPERALADALECYNLAGAVKTDEV